MAALRPRGGFNAGNVLNRSDADDQLAQMSSLGFRDLRLDVSAELILQPDWERLDAYAAQLQRHHLVWYPIICYSTSWDVDPGGIVMPEPARFARAAQAFVARYRPPRIEIWNEPNMPQFWAGSPQRYANLYAAVRRVVAPTTKVVTAGLANRTGWQDYLRQILNRLAYLHVAPDAIGFHPYRNDPVAQVRELRQILNKRGLTHTKIDITEYGRARTKADRRAYLDETTRGLMALGGIGVMRVIPYVWSGDSNFVLGPVLRRVVAAAMR